MHTQVTDAPNIQPGVPQAMAEAAPDQELKENVGVERPVLLTAYDPDAKISVPFHCLERMISALSHSDLLRPGTCLDRDCVEVVNLANDELKRTGNYHAS